MRQRPIVKLRPALERLDEKLLLSATARPADVGASQTPADRRHQVPPVGPFTLFRITNPTPFNNRLVPPFKQVLVQSRAPVPGQVYNVLFISLRNGTPHTFDANSGLAVRLTGQPLSRAFPILTGAEQWKPEQVMVFYVLTKKYYPVRPVLSAGFQFNFAGNGGAAIPGPSGIFLRVRYNPDTFANVLDWIVARGPGAKGHELGLPDTAIWEFTVPSNHVIPL